MGVSLGSIGFAGMVSNPSKADLRKMEFPVELPKHSEVYSVPVPQDWGKTAK